MIVMKFGGSSLANAERIKHVFSLISAQLKFKPVIVLSAIGDTTDHLLESADLALAGKVDCSQIFALHNKILTDLGLSTELTNPFERELIDILKGISLLRELSNRAKDLLVSFGERLSVRVVSAYFNGQGIEAKAFDAWEVGLETDSNFGSAEISANSAKKIATYFSNLEQSYSFTPFITGFIAKDFKGNITTLGRGGSDLTACAVGAAIKAQEVQVWKDVDGILTTNPNYVPEARPVPTLSFEEASELAYFGANVLHPRALIPAMLANIPVRVKNSYNPEHPGTVIYNQPSAGQVKAITCKRNLTLVDVVSLRMLGQRGFLAKLFQVFEAHNLSVDMVATSEVSVSLTLDEGGDLAGLREDLEEFAKVGISNGKASINLIGDVTQSTTILEQAFNEFHENKINIQMVSHGASKVQFGFIVNDSEAEKSVQGLHRRFFDI